MKRVDLWGHAHGALCLTFLICDATTALDAVRVWLNLPAGLFEWNLFCGFAGHAWSSCIMEDWDTGSGFSFFNFVHLKIDRGVFEETIFLQVYQRLHPV